ncbi:MAG TPA: type II secretion system F family protein [Pseudonocardia sp.]|jgi:Flp pilus assembly protein TadB
MTSLLLLAAALLVAPYHPTARARLAQLYPAAAPSSGPARGWPLPALCGLASALLAVSVVSGTAGWVLAVPIGVGVGVGTRRLLGAEHAIGSDPLLLAGGWDLLAACLRSGLPVPLAVRAVADYLPAVNSVELRTIADRLALGADPTQAWDVPETSPVHKLARAARRSAHSGAALASVAARAADELRAGAADLAAARGQRAGVLITGPLGLCFLPAFLALGVVPVVIGLASGLAVTW